jgi:hypothetical protein
MLNLFPASQPVTASGKKYTVVVFGIWALLLVPYWIFSARYKGSSERLNEDFADLI